MPISNQKPFGTKTLCKVCGHTFYQNKTGRFKEYCSDDCRDFNKFKNAFLSKLDSISFKDYSYIKSLKGELFRVVNSLPKKVNENV